MFAKRLKRVCLVGMLLTLMACGERQEYKDALVRAEAMMGGRPDSALLILDSLGQYDKAFGRHFRMQYLLHRMNAENKTDVKFTSDSLAKELVNHFDSHGTTNERVLAHYLLGRSLSDMEEAPAALQAYYDAISVADTLSENCDYNTLRGIYGQMASIFHQQNLPHDEIWAFRHYIDCEKRISSMEEYIVAKSQLIRPYYLLGEKDTVLQIISDTYQQLKHLGKDKRAASILPAAIYIYIERHDLAKAKEIMDIFEHESGLFDENGNIVKGRENYYCIKGIYEYAVHRSDSAELYFRKAIMFNELSEGYKGLLSIYKDKNDVDSIVHFANLYESAQDSLHNKMQTDVIHQMSALYNYTRSQKEANSMRARADRNKLMLMAALTALILVLFILEKVRRKQMKTKKENDDLLEENTELEEQKSAAENKLKEVTGKESLTIRKGARLYDQIASNKPVADWLPEDYGAFIGYYEATHYDSMRLIRKQYRELTNRKMLFVILEDMGKSTDDICQIMSLEKGSLRSLRFRLRNSKE